RDAVRMCADLFPDLRFHPRPLFAYELTIIARRKVLADHSGFDCKGSGATERVVEWTIRTPAGQLDKCCGERLLKRRIALSHPVAALVEARSACVDRECRHVFQYRYLDLEQCTGL